MVVVVVVGWGKVLSQTQNDKDYGPVSIGDIYVKLDRSINLIEIHNVKELKESATE